MLGATANQGLIEDLKVFGMHLNDPELSLQKPMQGLQEVLGEEATIVLISRIIKKMDELYSSKT